MDSLITVVCPKCNQVGYLDDFFHGKNACCHCVAEARERRSKGPMREVEVIVEIVEKTIRKDQCGDA